MSILPTPFRVTALSVGQSYDCPTDSGATLKNMDKWIMINSLRIDVTTTKWSKTTPCVFFMGYTLHIECVLKSCQVRYAKGQIRWDKINLIHNVVPLATNRQHQPSQLLGRKLQWWDRFVTSQAIAIQIELYVVIMWFWLHSFCHVSY